jgi:hypothetical protein
MIPIDLTAKLWAAAEIKAVRLGWPNAHAVVNVLLIAWLQDKDASAGGRKRASTLGPGTRSRIAREAAEARQAKMTPAERRALGRKGSDARWAAKRLADAHAATLPPLPSSRRSSATLIPTAIPRPGAAASTGRRSDASPVHDGEGSGRLIPMPRSSPPRPRSRPRPDRPVFIGRPRGSSLSQPRPPSPSPTARHDADVAPLVDALLESLAERGDLERQWICPFAPELAETHAGPVVLWATDRLGAWTFIQVLPTRSAGQAESQRLALQQGRHTLLTRL